MQFAYAILAITAGALAITVAICFGLRVWNLLVRRRADAYRETIHFSLAEYAVGAREDPPPPPKTRLQREVMRLDLSTLTPQVTGAASARLATLFEEYGYVESLHADLDSRSQLKRIRASETLGTFRVAEAIPWLRDHLDHDDLLRLSCARALAGLDDLDSLPAIVTALSRYHSSLVEVTDIVRSFGFPAVPLLRELLGSERGQESRLAADVLGEMRAFDAIPELRGALASPDDELAAASARALGRIGDPVSAPDLAAILASDRIWFVKVSAAHALGTTADSEMAPALVEALCAPEWYLRNAAAGSLLEMGDAGLDAAATLVELVPENGLAHYAGVLDVADELGSVIERAASGDRRLARFIECACGSGVHSRLDILSRGVGPVADFCRRVLASQPPGVPA